MSGFPSNRKDWRVGPGIRKPFCSVDQTHGTQSLNGAWYTKSCWLGQLQARDSKLFNLVGDAVWCDPRSMVEDHLENWCTTTFFAHLHRRHLDAAMNSAARVWPAKTVSGLQLPLRTSVWPTSKVLILLKVSLIVLVGPRQLRLDPVVASRVSIFCQMLLRRFLDCHPSASMFGLIVH